VTLPWKIPQLLGLVPGACWDETHFQVDANGNLLPQDWMQWRTVASVEVPTRSGTYAPTLSSGSADVFGSLSDIFGGIINQVLSVFTSISPFGGSLTVSSGGNKNDLLHDIQTSYFNDTPIDQWVYGKITNGGSRVTLTARSRGGLMISSGYKEDESDAGPLVECSMQGCGANMGQAGSLSLGTSFGIHEQRMNSSTIPLAPERTGWYRLVPGATLTARATMRFVSSFWENTTIDGGTAGATSGYESGGLRLDLFAVPALDDNVNGAVVPAVVTSE
jgi:hypothetical protein